MASSLSTARPSDSPSTNTLVNDYRSYIDFALTEHLFGTEEDLSTIPYDAPEVSYYVKVRVKAGVEKATAYAYEYELHRRFWAGSDDRRPQIQLCEGAEGSGKSTLLQYYFRYFFPHLPRIEGGNPSMVPNWEAVCTSHIFLYVDLRWLSSDCNLLEEISQRFRRQLATRFPNLDTRDSYAMWNCSVGGWDREHFRNLQQGTELSDDQFRAREIEKRKYDENNIEWVRAASSYLGSLSDAHGNRRWHITWVLDNADQLTYDQQITLVQLVQQRVAKEAPSRSEIKKPNAERPLWMAVLPLRPETMKKIERDVNPIKNKLTLKLGPPRANHVVDLRARWMYDMICDECIYGEEIVSLADDKQPRFRLTLPKVAATRVRNLFKSGIGNRRDDDVSDAAAVPAARKTFRELVNGSTRRLLTLRKRILLSRIVGERLWRAKVHQWTGPPLSAYYFWEGVICGPNLTYEEHDPENTVLNLYDLGADPGSAHSTLVGPCMCHLLRNNPWSVAARRLIDVGFAEEDLDVCAGNLRDKGILKRIRGKGDDTEYQVERAIVRAHNELLRERIYTDIMAIAMKNNLPHKVASRILITKSNRPEDIFQRVRSSIAFMEWIRHCEKEVESYETARSRHNLDSDVFRARFNRLKLPCVSHVAAHEYGNRLVGLPKKSEELTCVIQKRQPEWERLIAGNNILKDSQFDEKVRLTASMQRAHTAPGERTPSESDTVQS